MVVSKKRIYLIMGISGCGKSTIGKLLSREIGIPFLDADDFHPSSNVTKMSRGIPLTDEDRWPWLGSIVDYILDAHRNEFILACSALKATYRDYLAQQLTIQTVYLKISEEQATQRLATRKQHFMRQSLVASQLETLEEPETALYQEATLEKATIVENIISHFQPKA